MKKKTRAYKRKAKPDEPVKVQFPGAQFCGNCGDPNEEHYGTPDHQCNHSGCPCTKLV